MNANQELAAALAAHLPGWRAPAPSPDADWGLLVRADGASFSIRVGGFRAEGRVTMRGQSPRFRDGTYYYGGPGKSRHEITCDAKRSPESIAKDILRRFLPVYLEQWAEALAYVTKHDAHGAEAEEVAKRLAPVVHGRVGENKSRRGDGVSIFAPLDTIQRIAVQPGYDGIYLNNEVRVDIDARGLSPEVAAQILDLIQHDERERKHARVAVRAPDVESEVELDDDEVESVRRMRA